MLQIRSLKYRVLGINVRSLYMVAILILSSFNFSLAQKTGGATDEARNIPNYKELWANEPFAKYDPATEIIEKRDQVSKHFRNPDGSITAHIASGPIHYWEDEQWKTIFHTIEQDNDGIYFNNNNSIKTIYPKIIGSDPLVTQFESGIKIYEFQELKMSLKDVNGNNLCSFSPENNGTIKNFNKLTYPNIFSNAIDLEITGNTLVRKVDFVLKDSLFLNSLPPNATDLVFYEKIFIGNSIIVRSENSGLGLYFGGKLLGVYSQPEILNGNGKPIAHSHDANKFVYYSYSVTDGILVVNTHVNLISLRSEKLIYPVYIDPPLNVSSPNAANNTGSIDGGGCSTTSTTSPYYFSSSIYVGTDYSWLANWNQNGWARFDLSSITDTWTINSATLYYNEWDESTSDNNLTIEFTDIGLNPTSPALNSAASNSAAITSFLADIRDGSSFGSNNTLNGTGWRNTSLNASGISKIQNSLASDYVTIGFEATSASSCDEWASFRGYTSADKPYITIDYTSISVPVVTTITASSITNFTASSGGNVTSDGGASVTARGVLWGTSPGLTMPSANSTSDGTSTGSFTSSITGLSASTVYYYRAYALNSVGYGYGTEESFVTTGPTAAEGYYISGNLINNGEIISTYDENFLRMTGTSKTITGSGKFTNSKLFADGSTTFNATLDAASAFTETFVNAGKSLTISTGKTFKNGTMSNYGTLTLDGTGIITNSANLVNGGTLTVASTGEITVGGTWTNNSTFTPGSGLVTFDGSNNSIIGGSSALSFYKLTMNKSASTVTTTLAANATITNTLTLTLGHLVTGSYIAYVSNNASGAVSGGSSNSYVKGKLKRAVAGAYTYVFPVGQSLYEEAQLNFTAGYTSADITAFFTDGTPGALPSGGLTVSGTPLTSILDKGYWSIDPSAGASGSPTYSVTLKETGHNNGATSASQYTVIKRSNSPSVGAWSIQGTHSNTTQSDVGNVVTAVRSELATFSDFAIAYGGGALPIELISFQANCSDQNTVDVTWSTASEHNTNYFRVDKSRNGTQWDVLNTIGAAGNSDYTIDYALTDAFPNPGINYYRLTQYDNDGVFETFDAQAAVCKDQQSGTALSSYPNPSSGDFNVDLQTDELEGEATLLITDAKGAVVHSQDIKIIKGNNNFVIHPSTGSGQGFEPGIYYISVRTATSTVTTKHSMR